MFVLGNGGQTMYCVDGYWIQQEKVLFRQSQAIWIQYHHTPDHIFSDKFVSVFTRNTTAKTVVVIRVRHRQYDQNNTFKI